MGDHGGPGPDYDVGVDSALFGDADEIVVHSPHNRFYSALGMALGAGACALVWVRTESLWWRFVAVLVGLGLAAWAIRGGRIGVVCTRERVLIRELTRSRRLDWAQVQSVTVRANRRRMAAPVFVLNDFDQRGRTRVPAMCLVSKKQAVAQRWAEQLEAHRARVAGSSV